MNERSFIVKSELLSATVCFQQMRRTYDPYERWLRNLDEIPPLWRKLQPPAQWRRTCDYFRLQHLQRISGLGIRHRCGSMRHNWSRLYCRVEAGERIWSRLADELKDCGNDTQNTCGIDCRFHYAPALLL